MGKGRCLRVSRTIMTGRCRAGLKSHNRKIEILGQKNSLCTELERKKRQINVRRDPSRDLCRVEEGGARVQNSDAMTENERKKPIAAPHQSSSPRSHRRLAKTATSQFRGYRISFFSITVGYIPIKIPFDLHSFPCILELQRVCFYTIVYADCHTPDSTQT